MASRSVGYFITMNPGYARVFSWNHGEFPGLFWGPSQPTKARFSGRNGMAFIFKACHLWCIYSWYLSNDVLSFSHWLSEKKNTCFHINHHVWNCVYLSELWCLIQEEQRHIKKEKIDPGISKLVELPESFFESLSQPEPTSGRKKHDKNVGWFCIFVLVHFWTTMKQVAVLQHRRTSPNSTSANYGLSKAISTGWNSHRRSAQKQTFHFQQATNKETKKS